jgi:hypothetical protein
MNATPQGPPHMQRMGGNPLKEYRMPQSVFRMNPLYPEEPLIPDRQKPDHTGHSRLA